MYAVTQLARQIGVSQPTLTRFSQALRFNEYKKFQLAHQNFSSCCLWYDKSIAEKEGGED